MLSRLAWESEYESWLCHLLSCILEQGTQTTLNIFFFFGHLYSELQWEAKRSKQENGQRISAFYKAAVSPLEIVLWWMDCMHQTE